MSQRNVPIWCSLVWVASSATLRAQQTPLASPEPMPTAPTTPAPLPPGKGLRWQVGETTIKLGGYIKVDLIHDFDEIGSTDSFDPRTIPTDDDDGSATRLHARSTRLNLDLLGPSSAGQVHAFVEGDFFSGENGFRLRHAYGELGSVLGGQTWTTFMDEDAMPETLDFESPIAFPLVRQAQVRYTHRLEGGNYWAVSVEDPDSEVLPPAGVDGESDEPMPDLNARYRMKLERGHVQLSGFVGMAGFDPDVGSPDDVAIWGLNLSTKYRAFGDDQAYVQVTYGDGVGRYRGGTAATSDASGDLEAITVFGAMLGYQHHWNEEYRSTVTYSWGEGDVPDGAPPETNEFLDYFAANLIWQFTDRAWTGIEFLHGTRETFDDADGDANRIQLALRFDL